MQKVPIAKSIKGHWQNGRGLLERWGFDWANGLRCTCCVRSAAYSQSPDKVLPSITGRANPSETCSTMLRIHPPHLMTCSRSTAAFCYELQQANTAATKVAIIKASRPCSWQVWQSNSTQLLIGRGFRDECLRNLRRMQWWKIMLLPITVMATIYTCASQARYYCTEMNCFLQTPAAALVCTDQMVK